MSREFEQDPNLSQPENQYRPETEPQPETRQSIEQPADGQTGNQPVWTQDASGYYHYTGDPNPQNSGSGAYGGQSSGQSGYGPQGYQGYQQPGGNQNYQNSNPYGSANVPPTGPMSGYQVNPPEPPKKKKGVSGKAVAAIVVVCILVGCLAGGGIAALVRGSDPEPSTTEPALEASQEEKTEQEQENSDQAAINTTVIDVTTNSTETNMTPQDVYENYVNAVVAISNEGTTTNYWGQISQTASSGSGMIISKDGYILTNNHVVEGAEKLTVLTTAGEEYEAKVIGADSVNDVALIKIEGDKEFPTVSIGDSDGIQVGQQVAAIGNPLGELTNTLTVGYVSALDREIMESTGTSINMFQTDCAINSGNSGGPIFDMNGNVIGITTAKPSSSLSAATVEGIGFCIPINDAMDIVNDLLEYGYVRGRVSMGVICRNIDTSTMDLYKLPVGPYVTTVGEGTAAEKAGLQEGDLICEIDGEETQTITEMKIKLKEYKPGDTAKLKIYRTETGETLELSITFDEMQATDSEEEQEQQQEQQQQENPFSQINPFNPFG